MAVPTKGDKMELDRMINDLLGGSRRPRGGSRKLTCAECGEKITRAQYRESVHCEPCNDMFRIAEEEHRAELLAAKAVR